MEQDDKTPTDPTPESPDDIFGCMADKVKIAGDIVGPITPPEEWSCI